MTGAEAIDLLVARLQNRLNDSNLRNSLLLEMKLAQEMTLERGTFKPWFMWTDDTASLTTTTDVETVALPADFVGFPEEAGGLWVLDTSITTPDQWVPLKRRDFQTMKEKYAESETDMPEQWDMVGGNIYLRPIPDTTYSLRILYEAKQTAPADAATTNNWLTYAPDWLIAETGLAVMAMHLAGESDLVTYFDTMRQRGRDRAWREHEARLEALHNRTMGDD